MGVVKAKVWKINSLGRHKILDLKTDPEQLRWDPKDGELFLSRAQPEESLVEARSGADVQIARQTWI